MTTFTSDDADYAKRNTCEYCKRTLEIDAVHRCRAQAMALEKTLNDYLDSCNKFEAQYNARMGRSGVRWAGD